MTEIVRNYMTEKSSHNLEIAIVALITLEILFELLDKSEWWNSWTWESLLGIPPPDKTYSHHSHEFVSREKAHE